jgi:hypothetical protein
MAAYAYSYAHCAPYVGHWVVCRTASGVYRGILHRVTSDGIYLARARVITASGSELDMSSLEHADNPGANHADIEQVFGWPLFFIPFFTLFFFAPFFW